MYLALTDLCPNVNGIWQHINGWEVVAAVLCITVSWAFVSWARYRAMVELSHSPKPVEAKTDGQKA